MFNRISRQELKARIDRGEQLLIAEALPAMYYDSGHLPGAVNLPHDEVDALAPALIPDMATEVVVYCANAQCQNSHIAARRLIALGYTNVSVYVEGKHDWTEAGLPVESVAASPH